MPNTQIIATAETHLRPASLDKTKCVKIIDGFEAWVQWKPMSYKVLSLNSEPVKKCDTSRTSLEEEGCN
jgi:hypothetical protein